MKTLINVISDLLHTNILIGPLSAVLQNSCSIIKATWLVIKNVKLSLASRLNIHSRPLLKTANLQ